MFRYIHCALVGLTVILGWSALALAQEVPPDQGLTEEQARAHFNTGSVAFNAGRFEDALAEFQKSYALSARPKLHYNIGVVLDRLRRDQEAIAAFEAFLEQVPSSPFRAEVESRVAVLKRTQAAPSTTGSAPAAGTRPSATDSNTNAGTSGDATGITHGSGARITTVTTVTGLAGESTAPNTPPQAQATTAPTTGSRPSLGQWLAISGSGLFAITGGVLLTVALIDKAAVEDPATDVRLSEVEGAHDRVPLLSTLGAVMLGFGLAGGAATTAWIMLTDHDDSTLQARIGLGGLQVKGAF